MINALAVIGAIFLGMVVLAVVWMCVEARAEAKREANMGVINRSQRVCAALERQANALERQVELQRVHLEKWTKSDADAKARFDIMEARKNEDRPYDDMMREMTAWKHEDEARWRSNKLSPLSTDTPKVDPGPVDPTPTPTPSA